MQDVTNCERVITATLSTFLSMILVLFCSDKQHISRAQLLYHSGH